MSEVADRFPLDAALMPAWGFRVPIVMGNKDAVKAAEMLKAPLVIPIHMDITPRFPFLRTGETSESYKALMAKRCPTVDVVLLGNGGSIIV